jgi:RNA polymerase sigma factor (sigma-70 family)
LYESAVSRTITARDIDFAKRIFGKFSLRCPDYADYDGLEGAALLGLAQASLTYQDDKGMTFTTWAYHRVVGAMIDELRVADYLSRGQREKTDEMRERDEELPDSLKIYCSLNDKPLHEHLEEESPELIEMLEDSSPMGVNPAALCEQHERLADALVRLSDRERFIVIASALGYGGREIGDWLGVTESRISQVRALIARKALTKETK